MGTNASTPENNRSDIMMTDVKPLLELVENPTLTEVYQLVVETPATVPEIREQIDISKTAAYDYIEKLQSGGVVEEVGTRNGATVYTAHEFRIQLEVGDTSFELSSDLCRVIAESDTNQEIERFVDQYGIGTLIELLPLVREYADGEITHRMIANILDISRAAAFQMTEELLPLLDAVPESTVHRPETPATDTEAANTDHN
jgi:predicted transcriptional regulator